MMHDIFFRYTDENMFLDTIKIAIPLRNRLNWRYPLNDTKHWDKKIRQCTNTYTFNQNSRKRIATFEHEYIPTLEYFESYRDGGVLAELRLEFSVPKMLNTQNANYIPVHSSELGRLFQKLVEVVNGIYGIRGITVDDFRDAIIRRMDCMVTVYYPKHALVDEALRLLRCSHVETRVDVGAKMYDDGGHSVRIGCNNWEFVAYDKLSEVDSSNRRRAEENSFYRVSRNEDLTRKETFLDDIKKSGLGMLQCEVRFNSAEKINKALKKINETPRKLTIEEALDNKIPLRLLSYYLAKCIGGTPRYDLWALSEEDAMSNLLRSQENISTIADQFFAARLETMPQHKLSKIASKHHGRSWLYRFKKKIETIPPQSNEKNPLSYITDCLDFTNTEVDISNGGGINAQTNDDAGADYHIVTTNIILSKCFKNGTNSRPPPN